MLMQYMSAQGDHWYVTLFLGSNPNMADMDLQQRRNF